MKELEVVHILVEKLRLLEGKYILIEESINRTLKALLMVSAD